MPPCDRCNKLATVEVTEITKGQQHRIHLCDACAAEAGLVQPSHVGVDELRNQFLKMIESKRATKSLKKD